MTAPLHRLAAGQPTPADLDALAAAARALLSGDDVAARDALAVVGLARRPGTRSAMRSQARAERDRIIRAWRHDLLWELSAGQAARLIAERASRFQASASWASARGRATVPDDWRGRDLEYLWLALKTNEPFPGTARQVLNILECDDEMKWPDFISTGTVQTDSVNLSEGERNVKSEGLLSTQAGHPGPASED